MNAEDLHRTLTRVRSELSRATSVDEESRRLLQQIISDAERLPTRSEPSAHFPRGQRLEAIAVQFEANHPTLGAALRELIELLGKAGV